MNERKKEKLLRFLRDKLAFIQSRTTPTYGRLKVHLNQVYLGLLRKGTRTFQHSVIEGVRKAGFRP